MSGRHSKGLPALQGPFATGEVAAAFHSSLRHMLIEAPGGFDYTGEDCSSWMRKVGFRETYVEHLVEPDSMVVGIK